MSLRPAWLALGPWGEERTNGQTDVRTLPLLLYYTLLYPTSSPKKISNRNFIVCTRPKVGPSVRRSSLFRVPATLQVGFLVNQFVGLTVHRSVGPSFG